MYLNIWPSELAVVPILIGPLQVLLALLPGIAVAVAGLIIALFKPSTVKHLLQLLWSQKLIVISTVLIIWAASAVIQTIPSAGGADVTSPNTAAVDWSMLLGSNNRRGYVDGSDEPTSAAINWSFTPNGIKAFYATPAITGNRLYITSAQYGVFTDQGAVHCIDNETAKEIWRFDSSGYRSTFSSPVISGNFLVVGEGLHLTNDARVFCLDIQASNLQKRGVKRWEYRTKSHVESSPCIADGRVFIGAGSDGFYCFTLDGDNNGNAKVLWHLPGDEFPDCETSPAVYDGKVYFGLGVGGNGVVCADTQSGDIIWRIETPYPVLASPAIESGKVYIGMGHGDYVNTAEQVAGNLRTKLQAEGLTQQQIDAATNEIKPSGELWCIDAQTGNVDWRFNTERTILAAPAISDNHVYFGSRDGHIYCVTISGHLVKKWNTGAAIITSPAVGEQYIYVMTDAGQLYCLSKSNLQPTWDVITNSPSFSSPVVANGQVYVGTNDRGLLSLGQSEDNTPALVWQGFLGNSELRSGTDGSTISHHGTYAWGLLPIPSREKEKLTTPTIHAPAAYLNKTLYVGVAHDSTHGLAALDMPDKLTTKPKIKWLTNSKNSVIQSPAATEDAVIFADGKPGEHSRMLRCVDPTNGNTLWQLPIEPHAGGQFVINHRQVFIADTVDHLSCFAIHPDQVNQPQWREKIGRVSGQPAILGDLIFISTDQPNAILAIDSLTGLTIWRKSLASKPTTGPLVMNNRVWVGHEDSVTGFDLLQDANDYQVSGVHVSSGLVSNEKHLAFSSDNEIIVINTENGELVARLPGAFKGYAPIISNDYLLYYAKDSIQRYNLKDTEQNEWATMRPTWPGQPTSQMILIDSHVILATDRRSLICMKPKTR